MQRFLFSLTLVISNLVPSLGFADSDANQTENLLDGLFAFECVAGTTSSFALLLVEGETGWNIILDSADLRVEKVAGGFRLTDPNQVGWLGYLQETSGEWTFRALQMKGYDEFVCEDRNDLIHKFSVFIAPKVSENRVRAISNAFEVTANQIEQQHQSQIHSIRGEHLDELRKIRRVQSERYRKLQSEMERATIHSKNIVFEALKERDMANAKVDELLALEDMRRGFVLSIIENDRNGVRRFFEKLRVLKAETRHHEIDSNPILQGNDICISTLRDKPALLYQYCFPKLVNMAFGKFVEN